MSRTSEYAEQDLLERLGLAFDLADDPVLDVREIQTPWRYVLGIGISFALAVALLAGAVAYIGAAYSIRHADRRVDSAVDDRNDKLAEQQAAINEYRRQQCIIVSALPKPWNPEVQRLYDQVLRCPDLPATPSR